MPAVRDRDLVLLAGLALVLAVLPLDAARAWFGRFLGPVPPAAAIAAAGLAGWIALGVIRRAGWLRPVPLGLAAATQIAATGAALALPMVALDLIRPFPADINLALPGALAFYPAIGVVAEVAFHLIPLAVLLALGAARLPPALPAAAIAAVEPAAQLAFGGGDALRDAAMAAILFGFGLYQIAMFRRHGFAALILARLGYYLVWHILWGTARLGPALHAAA